MNKSKLMIGWSSVDITPDRPVNLYGQFNMRITSEVLDPVTATVLVIADAKNKNDCAIFISADTCVIPGNVLRDLRKKLQKENPEIPVKNIIFNSTHTHTAPALKTDWHPNLPEGTMTPAEYIPFFIEKIAGAVGKAWNQTEPGTVAWGFGYTVIGHNRRTVYTEDISKRNDNKTAIGKFVDGFAKMYGPTNDPAFSHMEGSEDHSVNILYTWNKNKKMTGAVINIPCPAQETGGDKKISADFWHEARQEIRKRHGQELFLLPQDSAAGGMTSRPMIERDAISRMQKLKDISSRKDIALRLANAFDDILVGASKDTREEVCFIHKIETIALTMREITDEEYKIVKEEYEKLKDDPNQTSAAGRCARVMKRYEKQQTEPNIPFEVHVLRLGDVSFATNSFELFTDFGLRIKARSPSLQTFLIQHCGSEEHPDGGTYLPTAIAEKNKGYSATIYCNVIGHQGGDILVEETLKMINGLWMEEVKNES